MKDKTLLLFVLLPFISCQNKRQLSKPERVASIVQEHRKFKGNVLVADRGRVIYKASFGSAAKEKGIDNTDTTRFLVGSLSKPITAILILKLMDEGLLKTTDRLEQYFTGIDSKVGSITVHQLLTHTSGLKELLTEEKNMNISALLQKASLNFEPGADFEYSNSGYVLLKEIAEKAARKGYSTLVQEYIFDPAGMTNSGVATDSNLSQLAVGYKDTGQATVMLIPFPMHNISGAGSIYSTADDLFKLDRALYKDQFISNKMRDLLLKQHVEGKYSYGWFVRERGGLWDVYFHRGSLPGFTAFISRRVQKDQFIVILSNVNDAPLADMENDISRALKD